MKIRNRTLVRIASALIVGTLRTWFWTVRATVAPKVPGTSPYEESGDEKYLYCIWHDGILGVILSHRCWHMAGLVSPHTDGSYVADIMQSMGIHPIRGSSHRRAAGALREMMAAAEDWHIAIATDGPRGPRREVKSGIVYLASKTGRPIVPVAFDAKSAWRVKGRWTSMVIPWPFRKAKIVGGDLIHIPPDLDKDGIEEHRLVVQKAMDDLTDELAAEVHGDSPPEHSVEGKKTNTPLRKAA